MTITPLKFFMLAGESSGDVHGQQLIASLKKLDPNLTISGIGGPLMEEAGLISLFPFESLQVMGFVDVIMAFPRLYRLFKKIETHILNENYDAVIFIDFPGFNLQMAKKLRNKGFSKKLIHFICPHVWVWRKYRIISMAQTLDLLMVLYPFEIDVFSKTSLKVTYVGNPIFQKVTSFLSHHVTSVPKNTISLFPGSRHSELLKNLPRQLEAAALIHRQHPCFLWSISCSHPKFHHEITSMIERHAPDLKELITISPSEKNYELMQRSYLAFATSGTITLELALHKVPTVVVYNIPKINFLIAKYIFRISLPFYCIVNIILNKKVYPEIIKSEITAEEIAQEASSLLEEKNHQHATHLCEELYDILKCETPGIKAAQLVLDLIQNYK